MANKVDESAHLAVVMLLNLFRTFHAVAVKADKEDPIVKEEEFGTAYIFLRRFYKMLSQKLKSPDDPQSR